MPYGAAEGQHGESQQRAAERDIPVAAGRKELGFILRLIMPFWIRVYILLSSAAQEQAGCS